MAILFFQPKLAVTLVILAISSWLLVSAANRSPKISVGIPYSGKKGVLQLSEDTPLNSYLAIMETKDDDSGPDGDVECVVDNPYISIPLVYPKTYKVELIKDLDRETVNLVQVSIFCNDKGNPPMTSTAVFTIEIMDINDNTPTFSKPTYNANVTEGAPAGTLVTRVKAIDLDAGLNGAIQYYFHNDTVNISSYFTIDNDTGKIFTKTDIDRETVNHFVFTVVAKDSGLPSLSSLAHVKIQVDDINDNAPVILTKELHINENEKQMSYMGTLQAQDHDIGKNSELIFSKLEDSESSSTAPFLIHPNGEVLSVVSLDREQRQQYTMDVAVRDKGSPRLSSKTTISIFVDDINDNAPIITSECLDDEFLYGSYGVSSNISSGFISIDWYSPDDQRIVYKVEATDDDTDENSELRYSIESAISGDSVNSTTIRDPLFQIDSSTGEISLRRFVHKSDDLVQILNISVTDRGSPPLAAFCRLNITIDVDVSALTTPKTTTTKDKSRLKGKAASNGAASVLSIKGVSNPRRVGAIVCVILLRCSLINLLRS